MAINKNAFLSIAADDISSDILELNVPESVETQDDTTMGSNTRLVEAGLDVWEISGRFKVTWGASSTEAKFQAIAAASNRQAALIYRPDTAVKSATNPEWTGTGVLTELTVGSGSTGDKFIGTFKFEPAGDLTRAVA